MLVEKHSVGSVRGFALYQKERRVHLCVTKTRFSRCAQEIFQEGQQFNLIAVHEMSSLNPCFQPRNVACCSHGKDKSPTSGKKSKDGVYAVSKQGATGSIGSLPAKSQQKEDAKKKTIEGQDETEKKENTLKLGPLTSEESMLKQGVTSVSRNNEGSPGSETESNEGVNDMHKEREGKPKTDNIDKEDTGKKKATTENQNGLKNVAGKPGVKLAPPITQGPQRLEEFREAYRMRFQSELPLEACTDDLLEALAKFTPGRVTQQVDRLIEAFGKVTAQCILRNQPSLVALKPATLKNRFHDMCLYYAYSAEEGEAMLREHVIVISDPIVKQVSWKEQVAALLGASKKGIWNMVRDSPGLLELAPEQVAAKMAAVQSQWGLSNAEVCLILATNQDMFTLLEQKHIQEIPCLVTYQNRVVSYRKLLRSSAPAGNSATLLAGTPSVSPGILPAGIAGMSPANIPASMQSVSPTTPPSSVLGETPATLPAISTGMSPATLPTSSVGMSSATPPTSAPGVSSAPLSSSTTGKKPANPPANKFRAKPEPGSTMPIGGTPLPQKITSLLGVSTLADNLDFKLTTLVSACQNDRQWMLELLAMGHLPIVGLCLISDNKRFAFLKYWQQMRLQSTDSKSIRRLLLLDDFDDLLMRFPEFEGWWQRGQKIEEDVKAEVETTPTEKK